MKVIICEYHPWKTHFRLGNHHYARMFLEHGWEVLWISHPVSPFHSLKKANRERVKRARTVPQRHRNGPIEYIPYTLLPFLNAPLLSSSSVLESTHRYFRPTLPESLRRTGFERPDLVWITDTSMHAVADVADAKAIAVRIADDNMRFKNTPPALQAIESRLIDRADVVFVTSQPLEEGLRPRCGSKLHLLRNGVDIGHFQGRFEKPDEYRDLGGPIAVYVGAIEEWFEPDWLRLLARTRDDVTIVLIGRGDIDLSSVNSFPNVRILGPRPYDELPRYLTHANVGIIPFKRTPLVESVSPLKLFEFLAAGLPVVSTGWKELESLGSPAMLASDATQFVHLVSRCINENLKEKEGDRYREYAKSQSWRVRFDAATDVLDPILKA